MRVLGFIAVVCLGIVVVVSALLGAVLVAITRADDEVPGWSS